MKRVAIALTVLAVLGGVLALASSKSYDAMTGIDSAYLIERLS